MEPARGESCSLRPRRGPAAPGEDEVPSLDHNSFHVSQPPITQGRKLSSHGSMPLRTVWKPQPHGLVAVLLGHMEPARGGSCPSRPRRGPAAHGEDRVPSPDQKSFHILTTSETWGRKRRPAGSIPPSTVWKFQPHWLIADWLDSWSQCAERVASRADVEVPPHPGGMRSYPRISTPSIYLNLRQLGEQKISSRGSIPPRMVWKPRPHWLIADQLGLMESVRGKSFPSGRRRGSAAPGEDKVLSPDHTSFHISSTPTTGGRKQRSHRMIAPRTARKPQPHCLISVGLVLMGSPRGESFLSDQSQSLATHNGRRSSHSRLSKTLKSLQLQ